MVDRALPFEPNARPRGRARAAHASEAELRDVVERAARLEDGLLLLEGAPLECIAVLLGVAPQVVERVRTALEDPALRDEARERFARAAARRPDPATGSPAPPATPRTAAELLAAAGERPDGLALLFVAAPECAAVAFGVHPELVHAARELAARRGLSPGLPPDA